MCKKIAASLSLTREVARRNAVTERENRKNIFSVVNKILYIIFGTMRHRPLQ